MNNNSSGMCCGVSVNTYHTLKHLRRAARRHVARHVRAGERRVRRSRRAARGAERDRGRDPGRRRARGARVEEVRDQVHDGLLINAFVDVDPSDRSRSSRRSSSARRARSASSRARPSAVPEHPHKASAFVMFGSMHESGRATAALRARASSARASLRHGVAARRKSARARHAGLADFTGSRARCSSSAAARTRPRSTRASRARAARSTRRASALAPPGAGAMGATGAARTTSSRSGSIPTSTTSWNLRKGLVPRSARAGGGRACSSRTSRAPADLADMNVALIDMFKRFGYDDACVMGHAMEGNMHLLFSQASQRGRRHALRRDDARDGAHRVRQERLAQGRARHGAQRRAVRRDGVPRACGYMSASRRS